MSASLHVIIEDNKNKLVNVGYNVYCQYNNITVNNKRFFNISFEQSRISEKILTIHHAKDEKYILNLSKCICASLSIQLGQDVYNHMCKNGSGITIFLKSKNKKTTITNNKKDSLTYDEYSKLKKHESYCCISFSLIKIYTDKTFRYSLKAIVHSISVKPIATKQHDMLLINKPVISHDTYNDYLTSNAKMIKMANSISI